jgi:hypothetical protein
MDISIHLTEYPSLMSGTHKHFLAFGTSKLREVPISSFEVITVQVKCSASRMCLRVILLRNFARLAVLKRNCSLNLKLNPFSESTYT